VLRYPLSCANVARRWLMCRVCSRRDVAKTWPWRVGTSVLLLDNSIKGMSPTSLCLRWRSQPGWALWVLLLIERLPDMNRGRLAAMSVHDVAKIADPLRRRNVIDNAVTAIDDLRVS
jgi:hypothetical protein